MSLAGDVRHDRNDAQLASQQLPGIELFRNQTHNFEIAIRPEKSANQRQCRIICIADDDNQNCRMHMFKQVISMWAPPDREFRSSGQRPFDFSSPERSLFMDDQLHINNVPTSPSDFKPKTRTQCNTANRQAERESVSRKSDSVSGAPYSASFEPRTQLRDHMINRTELIRRLIMSPLRNLLNSKEETHQEAF